MNIILDSLVKGSESGTTVAAISDWFQDVGQLITPPSNPEYFRQRLMYMQ